MNKIKLIQTRLARGLSQEELADLIGMSQSNYSRRESGRKNISDIEWNRISKELGVQIETIYEPEEQNKEERDEINMLYFNIPDFVMEHIELLKKENKKLKEQLKKLKNI